MNMRVSLTIGCLSLLCLVPQVDAQVRCFYAVVRHDTVEIHWCPPVETNFYGAFIQRRLSGEEIFSERPCVSNCLPLVGECICVDVVPSRGKWQYRLKHIDLDGTVSYTEPINVLVTVTSVGAAEPSEFSLEQNYPNPFNPSTEIRYQTPEVSHVVLKVFDVLGREVSTLVDEVQDSGFKSVTFDAGGLASGVYFYRLTAGSFVATKKFILAK